MSVPSEPDNGERPDDTPWREYKAAKGAKIRRVVLDLVSHRSSQSERIEHLENSRRRIDKLILRNMPPFTPPCGGIPERDLPEIVLLALDREKLTSDQYRVQIEIKALLRDGVLERIAAEDSGTWSDIFGGRRSEPVIRLCCKSLSKGVDNSEDWFPYDDQRIKGYLGDDPAKYKGRLAKLAKRFPEIRRDATPAERERFGNSKLRYVYSVRLVFDHTEGAATAETRCL